MLLGSPRALPEGSIGIVGVAFLVAVMMVTVIAIVVVMMTVKVRARHT